MTPDVKVYRVPRTHEAAYRADINAVPEDQREYLERPSVWRRLLSFFKGYKS